MANFGSRILNNAVSSLTAQQALIAVAGNNIANVNTPGYSRRLLTLEPAPTSGRGELQIGNGVSIGGLGRATDAFLERLLRDALGNQATNSIQDEFLGRIESLFNLTGDQPTIGSTLTDFYASIDDLSANPSSIELRANMLERAQDLVETIRQTYDSLAGLQREADQRIASEISTVNSITAQIADLNRLIKFREGSGSSSSEAADERDAREQLLKELAEKISFKRLDLEDGTVSITLDNGQALVIGETARTLSVTATPSFAPAGAPPGLDGGALSYIVFNFGTEAAPAEVDLTQVLKAGSGSIGGLLALRGYNDPANNNAFQGDGLITNVAARVEAITRSLLTSFNHTYLGPDRDGGTAGLQPSSGDLDGNVPAAVFAFFDFDFDTVTYGSKDRGVADGDPTTADLDDISNTTPVRNFSSILRLNFTDPRQIAAALDSGTGPPAAPVFSPGDGRNLLSLSALRTTSTTQSVGTYSFTGTLEEGYNSAVTYVGNLAASASVALSVSQANVVTAQNRRDSVSGVSLDEEFTSLVVYQKAYQASARMIRVADELLTQILQVI